MNTFQIPNFTILFLIDLGLGKKLLMKYSTVIESHGAYGEF
jgi:hypothetical protein